MRVLIGFLSYLHLFVGIWFLSFFSFFFFKFLPLTICRERLFFSFQECNMKYLCRGISNEEKVHLRQKLLMHLREENYKVE